MKSNIAKNYVLEIFIKTIFPIGLGLAIAGFFSLTQVPLVGLRKAFIDSLEIGLIVTGLLNMFGMFSFLKIKQKDKFANFVTENCIQQNCWGGVIDCNHLRLSNKTITIAHPNRKTLSSEAPILESYSEIDIIGFGQSRLREPFSPGELKRENLLLRMSKGQLRVRILAPIVKENYFKQEKDSAVAVNQNKFENSRNGSECSKIIDLIDWYMKIGKELVEKLPQGARNDKKNREIISNAINVRLHDKPLIPFYMRIKNNNEHSIHFGPYLPEKPSSETITFEINTKKYLPESSSSNFKELTHYFDRIWNSSNDNGLRILLEYYNQLKTNNSSKETAWNNAINII